MTSDEKRPTLVRYHQTTYQKLLKAASGETESLGSPVTVPMLTQDVMDAFGSFYPDLRKLAAKQSATQGELVTVPQVLEGILAEAVKKPAKGK